MPRLPTVVSFVPKHFEDGAHTGVPRFDDELRRAWPGLKSISASLMHHGCSQTHFHRGKTWRGRGERASCAVQAAMYERPQRWFVALARWTQQQFSEHYRVPGARILPSWGVDMTPKLARPLRRRPVVLGAGMDFNKGNNCIAELRQKLRKFEFRTLECMCATRTEAYHAGDAYLCSRLLVAEVADSPRG